MRFLFLLETLKFVPGRYLKMGIQGNVFFIFVVPFYDSKFLKTGIQVKSVSFYLHISFS